VLCADTPGVIDTKAEIEEAIKPHRQRAKILREEARKLRTHYDRADLQAEALERVAEWSESEIASLRENDFRIHEIERDKGWRREMEFACLLASETLRLYGTPLYGTIAAVTNVSLGKDNVEAHHVRDWMKDLRKPRTMRIRTPRTG
jgi:hypothetical protein